MSGPNGGRDRAYEALRESEELHRATLSSISDAVFMVDDEGEFTYICPNVDNIFGYVPDEVQAMGRISDLLGADLFDHAELMAKGEIRNIEREVNAKSGQRRTVLMQFKRVSIKKGTVLCTCRDVTELKQAERELDAVRLELAHAARLALVGELTTSIMHEIRQPLAAIVTDAAAGMRFAENHRDLHEIFEAIHHVGLSAAAIIDRLQLLARKRPLELQSLEVNHVVTDVLHLVAADAHKRCVALRAELAPALARIAADRVCLQQVILNLIVNAMDAVAEVPERQVVVRTWNGQGAVEIAVTDTGHGITPERMPKLFEAFFTTKKDGIGLGLAVSRSIVEAHHGRLWAENGTVRGATFRLTLPVPGAAC